MNQVRVSYAVLALLVASSFAVAGAAINSSPAGSGSSASPVVFFDQGDPVSGGTDTEDDDLIGADWSLILDRFDTPRFEVPGGLGFGGGEQEEFVDPASDIGSLLLIAGAAVAVVAGLAYRARRAVRRKETARAGSGGSSPSERTESTLGPQYDVGVEQFENPIYENWYEMVERAGLNYDPALTPAEISDLAVADGLPAEPVDEITTQFELVRYGSRSPTERRVDRVREALERVQRGDSDG